MANRLRAVRDKVKKVAANSDKRAANKVEANKDKKAANKVAAKRAASTTAN